MTDYKSMFEQAMRTLAAIDAALDIGDAQRLANRSRRPYRLRPC